MWVKVAIVLVLGLIFIQDMKSRSVSWVLFPILAGAFVLLRLNSQSLGSTLSSIGITLVFVAIQLLIVTAWFSFRQGKWIKITTSLLGWGDILFLVAVASGLSLLNFLLFYVCSLVFAALYGLINYRKRGQIPLAGLQALVLSVILIFNWIYLHFDLSDDSKLINLF